MRTLKNLVNSTITSARRGLAAHTDRLRQSFANMRNRLQEAVSHQIGDTVADAVREAVHNLLADLPPRWRWPPPERVPIRPSDGLWRDPDYPDSPDWYAEDLPPDLDDEPDLEAEPPSRQPAPAARCWLQAVANGLQAAGWWLRRRAEQCSFLAALSIGIACSVATLVAGPGLAHAAVTLANLTSATGLP